MSSSSKAAACMLRWHERMFPSTIQAAIDVRPLTRGSAATAATAAAAALLLLLGSLLPPAKPGARCAWASCPEQSIAPTSMPFSRPKTLRARPQERPAFRYRKRSRTVVDTAEEAYLRLDIPCGSPTCPACAPTLPALPPAPRHLVLPDGAALRECLEVWELAQVEGVVMLSSELRQVSRGRAWVAREEPMHPLFLRCRSNRSDQHRGSM